MLTDTLTSLLEPAVRAVELDFWGVELVNESGRQILRVYVDHEDGIDVDDCARASEQISAVLDVEDPIQSAYYLEVSSPGMERPLFTEAHFKAYSGEKAKLFFYAPVKLATGEPRKRLSVWLGDVSDGHIQVTPIEPSGDAEAISVPFRSIKKAHLEVDF